MNRTTRMLIVLAVALVAATVASYGVYTAVQRMPVRQVEIGQVDTVVAARPVPVGALLRAADVKVIAWPAKNPVPGSFTTVDKVVNRGVVVPIAENEPVTETKLASLEAGSGLPPTITLGMRAISVKVNEVIGVAGFVVPGTRVDVLVSVDQENRDSTASTVLSNVTVLSAGTRIDQENAQKDGKAIPTSVVTLMVTPEDAEKLTLASAKGRVMLSLRNPLDTEPTQTKGVRMASLVGPPSPPPVQKVVRGRKVVVAPPPPPPPPKPYTVETIRAAKRNEEVIR
jgi:pilus assembly protein CpaB